MHYDIANIDKRLTRIEDWLDEMLARLEAEEGVPASAPFGVAAQPNDSTPARPGLKDRVVPLNETPPDGKAKMTEQGPTASFYEGKRLPAVGEIWRTRANGLVAVLKPATVLDGGYNVVLLDKGDTGVSSGYQYIVNLDGALLRNSVDNASDLVAFVRRWAD